MSGNKVQPEFLKQGDEVAIISPSFFIEEAKADVKGKHASLTFC